MLMRAVCARSVNVDAELPRHAPVHGGVLTGAAARRRQLTDLKALLGVVGQTRCVLGCISQLDDGRFFLEDLSDALPLDLSEAETASGFYTGVAHPRSLSNPILPRPTLPAPCWLSTAINPCVGANISLRAAWMLPGCRVRPHPAVEAS